MDDILIERAENADQPALHRLWEQVFGDEPETVQTFFDRFPPEAAGWVVRKGGAICAMAYLLPGGWLLTETGMQAVGYVYAVATDPAERGKGYAAKLLRAMMDFADQRALLLYTRPAEASLFRWYAARMEAESVGCVLEQEFTAEPGAPEMEIRPLEPLEYQALREALLGAKPHVLLPEALLRVQKRYSGDAGGGLFAVGAGCCACELREGKLYVLELLTPDAEEAAMQALLGHFGQEQGVLRKPSDRGGTPVVAWRGEAPKGTNWGLFLE